MNSQAAVVVADLAPVAAAAAPAGMQEISSAQWDQITCRFVGARRVHLRAAWEMVKPGSNNSRSKQEEEHRWCMEERRGETGGGRIRARTDGPEDGVRPVRGEADVAEGLVERHHPRGLFAPRVIPAAPSRAGAHHFALACSPRLFPPLLSLRRTLAREASVARVKALLPLCKDGRTRALAPSRWPLGRRL